MNKLEKLTPEYLVRLESQLLAEGRIHNRAEMVTIALGDQIDTLIDHITVLEQEVDRLKGHTHDVPALETTPPNPGDRQ